jgi:protein TonB
MGYQALLFCPDEKLARVVSQVFSELEFAVDPVTEPFIAVKKLMAQRYDAIVVDCDNEQNSSLLLKSARTSTMNQGSLAIAMVEGQAGVANAYRIGANLVITKPINVEQTKGTLRVARGLLRKTADAATSSTNTTLATAAKESPVPPVRSVPPATRPIETVASAPPVAARPVAVPTPISKLPQFEAPHQAVASTKIEEKPTPVVTPAATRTPVLAPQVSAPAPSAVASVASEVKGDTLKPAPVRAVANTFTSQSAASAPAPAKEAVTQAPKEAEDEILDDFTEVQATAPKAKASAAEEMTDGPSFAAIGEDSGGSGSKKLMVAAAVLVFAAAGYIGWTKFSGARSDSGTQISAPAPQTQAAPAVVVPSAPTSTPVTASPVTATNRPSAAVTAPAPKNSPTASAQQSVSIASVNTSASTDLQPKKPASAPLIVKSTALSAMNHVPGEDSSQLPSALAVAPSGANPLGAVLSSAPSIVPKLSASRIRVSQGVSQGLVIKRVQPKYPANALSAHIEGAVQIEATINKEGSVVNPKVLSGEPTLAAAAVEAVRQWRYKPYYLDGDPVEIQTQITVNFKAH